MLILINPTRRRRKRGGRLRRKIAEIKECRDLLVEASRLVVEARGLAADKPDVDLDEAIVGLELALGAVAERSEVRHG